MTTWFIDPVAGTNSDASAGNGDSFATRRKSISNVVASALAPGDTIRVIADTDVTSLGVNGTWTAGPVPSEYGISSSTNATPIVVTLSSGNYASLDPAVGDTVIIRDHGTNTNANGVWELSAVDGTAKTVTLVNADGTNSVGNGVGGGSGAIRKVNSARIKLASALTKNVALCGNRNTKTNWTASANVTCSVNTSDWKEGGESQEIAVGSSFTTGMAAYVALGSATDFSGYKQLSFWIKQTSGTIGADGAITISLCSDTAGATPVDTFNVPSLGYGNRWVCFTVDKGSALGASIQSVAFNVVTDNGAQTFRLDNIIAVKDATSADSLGLNSLIGKNNGEAMVGIQSINGTRVMLEQETNYMPYATIAKGYFGSTETVTAYKREPLPTTCATSGDQTIQQVQDTGSSGSVITISGGWNRTDMSTQTGETWLDGRNGGGYALFLNGLSYVTISKLSFARYDLAIRLHGSNHIDIDTFSAVNMAEFALYCTGMEYDCTVSIDNCYAHKACVYVDGSGVFNSAFTLGDIFGGTDVGMNISTGCNNSFDFTGSRICGNTNHGMLIGQGLHNTRVYGGTFEYNTDGFKPYSNNYGVHFFDSVFQNNSRSSVYANDYNGDIYFIRCTFSDSTEFNGIPTGAGAQVFNPYSIYSHNHDNTADNHVIKTPIGTIQSETSVRHTASGISWKLSPNNALCTTLKPLRLKVGSVVCAASVAKTVSLWMRRTNTGLTARLICEKSELAGVTTDESTDMTAAADTWEQVSISFTPTEAGVVDIYAECFGGTTYSLYVDDLSTA